MATHPRRVQDAPLPGDPYNGILTHKIAKEVLPEYDDDEELAGMPNTAYIVDALLPEIRSKMISSAEHYGDDNPGVLGLAGQFSDIWRKIGPLKRSMWEGRELTRESTREILLDLIGHCLLSVRMIDRGERGGRGTG